MDGFIPNKELIMIVEDSPTQAMMLREIFEGESYDVLPAVNGMQAMKLIKTSVPDLILSDIIMPEMGGFELCRQIKADPERSHIPVVFMTALLNPEDIMKAIECGADGYLIKSYNRGDLVSGVRNFIGNKQQTGIHRHFDKTRFVYEGTAFTISSSPIQIINLLLSTYDSVLEKNMELGASEKELKQMNRELERKISIRRLELQSQIGEKRAAEALRRESENKYRYLVDNAPIVMFRTDPDGQLKYANEAFCELLSYGSTESLSLKNSGLLFKDSMVFWEILEKVRKDRSISGFEVDLLSRDEQIKHVLLNAVIESNEILWMMLDVTERKKAEERERNYLQELVSAKNRSEQSEKIKSSFLANMSHDILTPLNTLMGFSELISEEGLITSKINEYAVEINKNGRNIQNIVDNIISVAKLESGEVKIDLAECKINQFLLDLFAEYENHIQKLSLQGIELRLKRDVKEKEFTILTEPYRIRQVLSNLLTNAIRYTETGFVEFGYLVAEREAGGTGIMNLTFYVKDTGSGIPEEKKNSIFDRFRNVESTGKLNRSGPGIGFPLSKVYIKLLGGNMWFESRAGEGSTFYFTLPCQVKNISGQVQMLPAVEKTGPIPGKGLEILVADANESDYLLIKAILRTENDRLTWAKNEKEAVDRIGKTPGVDLILTDLQMHDLAGYNIPVIILTASTRDEDRQKILDSDCVDYLSKPIDSVKLLNLVNGIRNETAASGIICS
ncbi:MAG: response regulator [Bacteroidota bacterium]